MIFETETTYSTLNHLHIIVYLMGICIVGFFIAIYFAMKKLTKKSIEIKLLQQQHVAKVDNIRKEHSSTLEKIRIDMLKREEERTRQWMESERETLHVLNGVSELLELGDRVEKIQFKNLSEGLFIIKEAIIEEKVLIEKLRVSDEKYNQLFNNSIVGIALHEMIYDITGKPCDYKYIDVNPAFEDLTGFKRNEIIGHTVLELIPDLEPRWIENYGKIALTGMPMFFEGYNKKINKNYKVSAYSPEQNKFIAIFMVIK